MPWTLANVVRAHATASGVRPMMTFGTRTTTYAEMHARSSRVARARADEGVGAQDRVAFLERNGPEYFEVLFGGGKINAVNVAVNWCLAPAEMAYTIDDADAKVLLVGPDFLPRLAEIEDRLRSVTKIAVLGGHPHPLSQAERMWRRAGSSRGHLNT